MILIVKIPKLMSENLKLYSIVNFEDEEFKCSKKFKDTQVQKNNQKG